MPDNPSRWLADSPMTDPGAEAFRFDDVPADVDSLCQTIHGVLIHAEWLSAYGEPAENTGPADRETLPMAARLARIASLDDRPLPLPRAPKRRSIGTCRDFALMACALLRHQGVPARVRCGFASYFHDRWEDHWICEAWDPMEVRWRRIDAQLDAVLTHRLGIGFDPTDLPGEMFATAGDVWRLCRDGRIDPGMFGHANTTGLWFVRVDVVRDHLALNDRIVSAWDSWRDAKPSDRIVVGGDRARVDSLALAPEQAIGEEDVPPWMA